MRKTLTPAIEQIFSLPTSQRKVRIQNDSNFDVYIKGDDTVTVGDATAIKVKPNSAVKLGFWGVTDIHAITSGTGEMAVLEISAFDGVHLKDIPMSEEHKFDLGDTTAFGVKHISGGKILVRLNASNKNYIGASVELKNGEAFIMEEIINNCNIYVYAPEGNARVQIASTEGA